MKRELKGNIQVILAATGFGLMGVGAKIAYEEGTTPITVLAMRFWIAIIFMWMCALVQSKGKLNLERVHAVIAFLIGGVVYAAISLCYFLSLSFSPASIAAVCQALYPLFVNLYMLIFRHEQLTLYKGTCLGIAVLGVIMMVWEPTQAISILGICLGILSSLFYAAYIILLDSKFAEPMHKLSPMTSNAAIMTCSAITVTIIGAATKQFTLSNTARAWSGILLIAIFSTAIPITVFYIGILNIGPSRASILGCTEPMVTVLLSILVLREHVAMLQLSGICFVLAAIILINLVSVSQRAKDI